MFKFLKRKRTQIPHHSPNAAVARVFTNIRDIGLNPKHIVDIGGNRGGWRRTVLSIFPQACLSIFEPQRRLATYLADLEASPNVVVYYKGVGDFDGIAPFTLHHRDDSCSFVYDAEEAKAHGFIQSEIEICKLDTAMADSPFGAPDIVKIDAEGLDLKVLEGAAKTLRETEIVLIEASVSNPDYPNSVLAVVKKMDQLGFRLFDFTDLNRTPNRNLLWLVEGVFVRKGHALDIASSTYD